MLQALRRHPLPMRTRFGHSLVLTYALPPAVLEPLLPPGLALDTYTAADGSTHGFVAVGIVSTQGLRPAPLPSAFGIDVVLTGYRIFARFPTPGGRTMRGLYILRSDTHRVALAAAGNLLTRYHYRLARVRLTLDGDRLTATVDSRDGGADLTVTADLGSRPAPLPPGSPFARGSEPLPPGPPFARGSESLTAGPPVAQEFAAKGSDPQPLDSPVARRSEPLPSGSAFTPGSELLALGSPVARRGASLPAGSAVGSRSARMSPGSSAVGSEPGSSAVGSEPDSSFTESDRPGSALPDRLLGTVPQRHKLISSGVTTHSRSVESDAGAARRFAGPLPYTFDYEAATGSIVVVKAHRSDWTPEPVAVHVSRCTFLERGPFAGTRPVLAQAFHVAGLDYSWHRGVRRALDGSVR
ncbi:DUF2071 domain-containing protein [Dactylosporangium sp. NBC_01737]|uniref:DUF2071 domain-containing protein n=1 Tax=Dactylosporangium sp. NBC_01737 TaxID=2975959 RepID=UPI002E0F3336|nr:DUF2071 domain-containing protein [Dactylosporangium sp. NBC_01737]